MKPNAVRSLDIFSFIVVAAIITWVSSEFYGGMIIYFLMYWWIIIPLVIGLLVTSIITVSRIIQHGLKTNKISTTIHSLGLIVISAILMINSELFKSKALLEAVLIDDLSAITIKLRSDGTFDTTVTGMFGFVERISGQYYLEQDTIVFRQPPYSNDFIPNTIIIDRSDSALYFKKLPNGKFDRTKTFVNYFEIRKIDLE